jgi:hypothetical protein
MRAVDLMKTDIASMNRSLNMEYKAYQTNIWTDVIESNLASVVSLNAQASGEMSFVMEEDGAINMVLTASDTNSSTNNTYKSKCALFNTANDVAPGEIFKVKIPSFKILLDIIKKNSEEFTGLDFEIGAKANSLRIGFINLQVAGNERNSYVSNLINKEYADLSDDERADMISTYKLSIDEKLSIRKNYINSSYYMTIAQ